MVKYYPRVMNFARIAREFPELDFVDAKEEQRLIDVDERKKRGKGTPKKAKNASKLSFTAPPFVASVLIAIAQVRVGEQRRNDRWGCFLHCALYTAPMTTHGIVLALN